VCGVCDIENKVTPVEIFSDDDYERIINGILIGAITIGSLDVATYTKTAQLLTEAVYQGYGKTLAELQVGGDDYAMLFDLRKNVYVFSGAKTYQQTREIALKMSELLTKDGGVNSLAEFKREAQKILITYNKDYLTPEYNSAIAQARSNSQFGEFIKDAGSYPNLTYHTVGDARVRPTHAALDGITRQVGDNFWRSYMPPNGWNCRCTVIQTGEDAERTSLRGFKKPNDVPDIFLMNSYYDRIVFSKEHPYFKVAPKDKTNAKNNWGLPLP
jgi:SPP1 gp7 family putative phage head morphogenesis protein